MLDTLMVKSFILIMIFFKSWPKKRQMDHTSKTLFHTFVDKNVNISQEDTKVVNTLNDHIQYVSWCPMFEFPNHFN